MKNKLLYACSLTAAIALTLSGCGPETYDQTQPSTPKTTPTPSAPAKVSRTNRTMRCYDYNGVKIVEASHLSEIKLSVTDNYTMGMEPTGLRAMNSGDSCSSDITYFDPNDSNDKQAFAVASAQAPFTAVVTNGANVVLPELSGKFSEVSPAIGTEPAKLVLKTANGATMREVKIMGLHVSAIAGSKGINPEILQSLGLK